jgi:TonB family protein
LLVDWLIEGKTMGPCQLAGAVVLGLVAGVLSPASSFAEGRLVLTALDGHDTLITLHAEKMSAREVLEILGRAGGFDVVFEGEPLEVTVDVRETPIANALRLLAEKLDLEYDVLSPKFLVAVGPDAIGWPRFGRFAVNSIPGGNEIVDLEADDVRLRDILERVIVGTGLTVALESLHTSKRYSFHSGTITRREALTLISEEAGISYRLEENQTLGAVFPRLAGVGGVTNPERLAGWCLAPVYPELARKARIDGKVFLQVVVEADGSVSQATLLRCNRPGVGFEDSAITAVEQWRYRPSVLDNEPVPVFATVIVDFTVPETDGPPDNAGSP